MPQPVILHIDSGTGFRGGQRQLLLLAERLRANHVSQILAIPDISPLSARIKDIPLIKLQSVPLVCRIFLGRIIEAVTEHGITMIHAHDSDAHSVGIALKKAFPHLKLIVSRRVIFPPSGILSRIFKYRRHVDRYIAVSHAVKQSLISAGVSPDKIAVVHSALDIIAIKSIEPDNEALAEFKSRYPRLIASAGALTAEKDFATAIRVAHEISHRFRDVGLVIMGAGPLENQLRGLIDQLQMHNVFLAGHREPLAAYFKCAEAFLLTSRSEGLNNSAIEAAACGLPLVVSNVGGLPEIVSPGENGFLCEPGNSQSYSDALTTLFQDDTLRRCMGAKSAEIAERFDISELYAKTVDIYNSLSEFQTAGV